MRKLKYVINETYKVFANAITNEKVDDINEIIWKIGYITGRKEEQRKKGELEILSKKDIEKYYDMSDFVKTMLMTEEEYNERYSKIEKFTHDTADPSRPTPNSIE